MRTTTVVLGAGHAGLAMSRCLADRSIDHVLIERGEVANSWRKERWDSLRLLTPNWQSRLPGYAYRGDDPDGYMAITDRTKDVIKSGGEWISSIELENTAMGHPAVAEAAVIGVSHAKWTERPLLIVVLGEGQRADKEELLAFLKGKVADWWIPTDVAFVDEMPHTATGKIKKIELRKQFADYEFPA